MNGAQREEQGQGSSVFHNGRPPMAPIPNHSSAPPSTDLKVKKPSEEECLEMPELEEDTPVVQIEVGVVCMSLQT